MVLFDFRSLPPVKGAMGKMYSSLPRLGAIFVAVS